MAKRRKPVERKSQRNKRPSRSTASGATVGTVQDFSSRFNSKGLHWIAMGGKEEVGGNCDIFASGKDVAIFDLGCNFGRDVGQYDSVVPDVRGVLRKNASGAHSHARLQGIKPQDPALAAKAIFITHRHLDHIGGLVEYSRMGYELPPIYGSKETLGAIRQMYLFHKMSPPRMMQMDPGQPVQIGDMKVEAVQVPHSCAGAYSFCIEAPDARIVYSGDYKTDSKMLLGPKNPIKEMRAIGARTGGVDAFLGDSTRANLTGVTTAEEVVERKIKSILQRDENKKRRVIVSVMSTCDERILRLLRVATETGRTVVIEGPAIADTLTLLRDFCGHDFEQLLGVKPRIVDGESLEARQLPPEKILALATGTQGEYLAAMPRAARGEHPRLRLGKNDLVINSASFIPGNEGRITAVHNGIRQQAGELVTNQQEKDVHTSGHGAQGDIKKMVEALKPAFLIPVHGDERLTKAQAQFAKTLGVETLRTDNWQQMKFERGQRPKQFGGIQKGWIGIMQEDHPTLYRQKVYNYSHATPEDLKKRRDPAAQRNRQARGPKNNFPDM